MSKKYASSESDIPLKARATCSSAESICLIQAADKHTNMQINSILDDTNIIFGAKYR